ncbi:hypothetical protein [Fictibacillus phosphorivorans]|uniref:hypothetical protein n=1 Tax=Fictibacillus phosphorivorans TaxID=1221500 RepID=UPI0012940FD9|nr:hypothetical protein [Fictibacillus phosphorivorans]MQR95178.1 hypothetical protein [Fictibacillus phosphorivorans]
MEKWLEILTLAAKIIWVQIQTVIHPITELTESAMNSFWFVFSLTIIAGYILLRLVQNAITFYQAHNFIHRKMNNESVNDIEFTLFMKSLWKKDRSKGLLANAKSAKSRYLQFNAQERLSLQNYLQHRLRFLRTNQPLFILGAVMIGLLSSISMNVLPIEAAAVNAENVLKTTLFILSWLLIMQAKYVSMKKQTYHHLAWMQDTNRTTTVDYIHEEDVTISSNKENNPAY